ncbi:HIR complex subunit [Dipsacomyces acuminosporus]|nr:HIR complex subunit [Dipsacomyces acuminosporus]
MRISKPEWLRHDADKKKLTAIFSLDFHPDGTRLATAGMDNKIRIWNTHAITQHQQEQDKQKETPRLLSTLTSHSGAVMCVRFSSGDGRYLASGADDMIVLIWERDMDESTGFGGAGNISSLGTAGSSEVWRPVRRLTGHESDVCDLAWSPDNRWLATCGLDNAVYIWDGTTFERVKKLAGHSQFVKGLTFDPAGKYLATQSDDKTLKIWRTSDWALHKTVSKPYEDNIFSTYFRRPSWSPDGDCIATANAANGKVPVAAIVNRGSWKADLSFVGHRAAIEAVRFNPRVFTTPNTAASTEAPADTEVAAEDATLQNEAKQDSSKVASVCAAGGQDRGVTVWLTSQHMPIAAATNLFNGNLLDLAWHTLETPDGAAAADDDGESIIAYLAACSYDGTVALMEFTQNELGRPVPIEDQEGMLVKHGWIRRSVGGGLSAKRRRGAGLSIVGDSDDDMDGGYESSSKKPRPIAETVTQLLLEEKGTTKGKTDEPAPQLQPSSTTSNTAMDVDKETITTTAQQANQTQAIPVPVRTKDGRKRVTPLFVRPLGSSSTPARSSAGAPAQQVASAEAPSSINHTAPTQQQVIAVPEGISSDGMQPVKAPIWIESRVLGTRHMQKKSTLDEADQYTHPATVITQPVAPLGPQTLVHAQSVSAARVHLSVPRVVALLSRTVSQDQALGRSGGKVVLAAYNHLKNSGTGRTRLVCSKKQSADSTGGTGQEDMWVKYFSCPVILLSASEKYAAVCLRDGSMHWFDSHSGARLLPALMREAHPAHLQCAGPYCLVLDSVGQLSVWNVDTLSAVVADISIAPLLYSAELVYYDTTASDSEDEADRDENGGPPRSMQDEQSSLKSKDKSKDKDKDKDRDKAKANGSASSKSPKLAVGGTAPDEVIKAPKRHKPAVAVTAADVNPSTGAPVLSLSDGRSFVYHLSLKTWLRIGDPGDYRASDFAVLPQPSILYKAPSNEGSGSESKEEKRELAAIKRTTTSPLAYIQEVGAYQYQRTCKVNRWPNKHAASGKANAPADVRRSVTLDHLEQQLSAAGLVGSDEEVIRWADILARHLARSGDEDRTTHWLADLLGPPLTEGLLGTKHSPNDSATGGLPSWSPAIANVPKRQILRRMLPILATNRHLQAVVAEYSTALDKLLR